MRWTVLLPAIALVLFTGVARADNDDHDDRGKGHHQAPEFSAAEVGSAVTLLAGGLMVLAGRRRKSR